MNDAPTLSERFKAAQGTAVYGAPVSYLFRLIADVLLRNSGGVSMYWVFAGIVLFIVLGFALPRSFGQTFTFWKS